MRIIIAVLLVLLAGAAWAQELDDAAALALLGSAPPVAGSTRPWSLFIEGAAGRATVRDATLLESPRATMRLSINLQIDTPLTTNLRAVLANRLDVNWERRFGQRENINTLKEAYLSWQPQSDMIVDLGRVNQYSGVGIGYNPTDFFRAGAVRSVVSADPTSIKRNRLGSVMLRGQVLWDGASLTALYSPQLGVAASRDGFSPDWGATNPRERTMLIYSKRLSAELNPQWLLYKEQGAEPQLGMNLTRLVDNATVAYVEWAGGRSRSLLDQALGIDGKHVFRNRVAAGLTYSTSNKLSLTLEYEYNGSGLVNTAWGSLPSQTLPSYVRYRKFASSVQEMPTRRQTLLYATWQDALIRRLDMTALVRLNDADQTRLSWAEFRYRLKRDEIALQWQGNSGSLFTEYGATPVRKTWQLLYRHFF